MLLVKEARPLKAIYHHVSHMIFFDKTHEVHKLRGLLLSLAEAKNAKMRAQPTTSPAYSA